MHLQDSNTASLFVILSVPVQVSAGWRNIYEDMLTDCADIMVWILSLFY